jgi:hypothetical protein
LIPLSTSSQAVWIVSLSAHGQLSNKISGSIWQALCAGVPYPAHYTAQRQLSVTRPPFTPPFRGR